MTKSLNKIKRVLTFYFKLSKFINRNNNIFIHSINCFGLKRVGEYVIGKNILKFR